MKFIVYNNLGEILRTGSVPEEFFALQTNEGEFIVEGEADPQTDMIDPETKAIVPKPVTITETTPESYAEIRKRMYPSTGEQLDMLWHAMNNGLVEKSEPFYTSIKTVKDAVPKDVGTVFTVQGS